MEESFRVRVEKTFGSLASSSLSSLWCLSDEEIQRREWNRDRDVSPDPDLDSQPYPSKLDGFFASRQEAQPSTRNLSRKLQVLDDEDEDEPTQDKMRTKKRRDGDGGYLTKPDRQADDDDDDWDIRSSIGLDCTLDYEEEEDQHDRFAVGREKAADRLYMREMVDYGINVNNHSELPSAINEVNRDPRANHIAAKLRLREDAEAAGSFDSLNLSDISMPPAMSNELETGANPKPILKKRDIPMDARSAKRVRFEEPSLGTKASAESCQVEDAATLEESDNLHRDQFLKEEAKAVCETFHLTQDSSSIDGAVKEESSLSEITSRVPDYVRNPSRYTRYTLDSSDDMDEESNKKTYMDFLNLLKKPNATDLQVDGTSVTPKPVIFTPKKKARDTSLAKTENMFQENQVDASKDKASPVSIVAGDTQDEGVCAMEEDGLGIAVNKSFSLQKSGRRYRTRTSVDNDDHVT